MAHMNRQTLAREFQRLLGTRAVLYEEADLALYEYDGSIERGRPDFVVFPRTTEDVVEIVKIAVREQMPFAPRGAGTGLSGGAIAEQGGILIATSRMNQILEIDPMNLRAVVQPGVVNADISAAVAPYGLYYVPDPSSQKACTIGGNVAENSGGPHCLAYGVTTNHTLGLEVVLPEGRVIETDVNAPGYDLTGLLVGSEGTLGIVTKIVVRLVPLSEQVRTLLVSFNSVEAASEAVSAIIASGTVPAAIEMMDNTSIIAVEAAKHCGYPTGAGAVLLKLCAHEFDVLRRIEKTVRGAVQRDQAFAAGHEIKKRLLLVGCNRCRVGVDDQAIVGSEVVRVEWDGWRRVITCRTA